MLLGLAPAAMTAQSSLKVKQISFPGRTAFSETALKDVLKVQEGESFNRRLLNLDVILITNYYTIRGFLDVFVSSSFRKDGSKIFIKYEIREGQRYRLKEVSVSGNESLKPGQLRKIINIADGGIYEPPLAEAGINDLETWYLNHGKPYVMIGDSRDTVEDSMIVLNLFIYEGETVEIGDIRYDGRTRVREYLLERELTVKKGDIYSRKEMEASQRNIYSTGLFKAVNYFLEPIDTREDSVRLVWHVEEKKPLWLGLRFGVTHEDRTTFGNMVTFDFTFEGGYRNLFGTARSISASVIPSLFYGRVSENAPSRSFANPRNQLSLSYVEPWLFGTRTPGVLRLAYSQEEEPISIYPLTILSASFTVRHNFENHWSISSGVALQAVESPDQAVRQRFGQGQDLIYSISFDPVKDKRDNLYVPVWGYVTEFRNKFVYALSTVNDTLITVISDVADTTVSRTRITNTFLKFVPQWNRYQRFFGNRNWILATRLRGGTLLEMGGTRPIRQIPVTERFYLGGASTVRGYAEQSIGGFDQFASTDGTGSDKVPIGGKHMLVANAELRIPLKWGFYGELFLDAGNVWRSFEALKSFSLRMGTGAGLAYITPFGPVRLDYGVKLFPQPGDSFGELHLGISFAF